MTTVEESIRAFLLDPRRRKMLTVSGIETVLGISSGNLAKFLAGKRPLPSVQIAALQDRLKYIGFGLVFDDAPADESTARWGNTLPLFEPAVDPKQEAEATFEGLQQVAKRNFNDPSTMEDAPDLISQLTAAEGVFNQSVLALVQPEPTPAEVMVRRIEAEEKMTPLERIREREAFTEAQERQERDALAMMPAEVTGREISQLVAKYKKRKMKTALYIRLRLIAPVFENKMTWTCFLELAEENGKLYKDVKRPASPAFLESIFKNKSWTYTKQGGVSFYTKPVGNPVIVSTPTDKGKSKK